MTLSRIQESLILATYFRGGSQDQHAWTSCTDQIHTLSMFYTGDITGADCAERFSQRPFVQKLREGNDDPIEHPWGKLSAEINGRYRALIDLLRCHSELIEGGGNFETPAHPTYTACRLTDAGMRLAVSLEKQFPKKPDFPNWADVRRLP